MSDDRTTDPSIFPPGLAGWTAPVLHPEWVERFGRVAYEGYTREAARQAQDSDCASIFRPWDKLPKVAREAWANAARAVVIEISRERG